MMRGTCVEFINKIKQEAITKNNKELFTIINEFQDKIISQNNTKPVEDKPKPLNLKIVDNISGDNNKEQINANKQIDITAEQLRKTDYLKQLEELKNFNKQDTV